MAQYKETGNTNWHRFGLSLSFLCGIHCLAMPFIIAFLPFAGHSLHISHDAELWIMSVSVLLALVLLARDYQRAHRNMVPLMILATGVSVFLSSHFMLHFPLLDVASGLLVFTAFFVNRRMGRQPDMCCTE